LKLKELAAQQEAARAIEEALAAAKAAASTKAAREAAVLEAAIRGEEPPTDDCEPVFTTDELVGSMIHATEEGQKQFAHNATKVKKHTDWAVKRVDVAKNFIDAEQKGIQVRAEDFAIKEVSSLMHKLDMAMQAEDGSLGATAPPGMMGSMRGFDRLSNFFAGAKETKDTKASLLEEVRPNPLSALIVGALAPNQLKWMLSSSQLSIVYSGIVLATAFSVLILHVHTACGENLVWYWLYVVVGTNFAVVLISAVYRTWCSSALEVVRAEQVKMKDLVVNTGNPVLDTFSSIQNGVALFVRAAFLYSGIVSSWFYVLMQLAFFVNTLNGGFGLVITIWKVREHENCAKPLVLFLHIYSLGWLLILSCTLVSFTLWLVSMCSRTPVVNDWLLNAALSLDKRIPGKLPVLSTLSRALFLPDSGQVLARKNAETRSDVSKLEKAVKSVSEKLAAAKVLREKAQTNHTRAEELEAELVNKYKAKLETLPQD
jgi:hypothetical protein